MKIYIESESAYQDGQKLLDTVELNGNISKPEGTRSLDPAVILDIAVDAAKLVASISTTAYNIWKWRQELKKEDRVVLEKEDEKKERLLLEHQTTTQEIETFLKK